MLQFLLHPFLCYYSEVQMNREKNAYLEELKIMGKLLLLTETISGYNLAYLITKY